MKRSGVFAIVGIVVVAILIWFVVGALGDDNETASVPEAGINSATNPSVTPTEDTPSDSPLAANEAAIDIANFAFSPSTITVKKGSTVTWTNQDSVAHTVTPDDEAKSTVFNDSGLIAQGKTFSVTFTDAGTYTYHCTPHPHMKGTVKVIE